MSSENDDITDQEECKALKEAKREREYEEKEPMKFKRGSMS
jgi:hypothetical protein